MGETAYGLQLHPEVDVATFADWAGEVDEALARSGRDAAEAAREVAEAEADLIAAWRPVTRAWAGLVREFAAHA